MVRTALVVAVLAPLAAYGADREKIRAAVERGLHYLDTQQQEDGSWKTRGGITTGITGLAVSAYLSAGETPGVGKRGKKLAKAIAYLLNRQDVKTGIFRGRGSSYMMYEHGIALRALAMAYPHLNKSVRPRAGKAIEKGVQLLLKAQSVRKRPQQDGGWRYNPSSRDSDLSVTGWQVAALKAAKSAGFKVPQESFDDAGRFARRCFHREGFGYTPAYRNPRAPITAVGARVLFDCGMSDVKEFREGVQSLMKRQLLLRETWFYCSAPSAAAAFHNAGEKYQRNLQEKFFPVLLSEVNKDGSIGKRGGDARRYGPIYSTSLAILALTVEPKPLVAPRPK